MIVYRNLSICIFVTLLFCQKIWCFESLLYNDLYSIEWSGPLKLRDEGTSADLNKKDSIVITTNNKEKYQCVLPTLNANSRSKFKESFSSAKLELEFLRNLLDSNICVYRLEIYWTYEFCHGKYIRQYHEEREIGKLPVVQEYYLGRYSRDRFNKDLVIAKESRKEGIDFLPSIIKVEGVDMPYYEVVYDGGTSCDLNSVPRRTRVLFVCFPDKKGEIYELKETSSCEYEVIVLTSALCEHPSYGPRKDPIHNINCHSLQGSPWRPLNLEIFELQNTLGGYKSPEEEIAGAIWDVVKAYAEQEEEKNKKEVPSGKDAKGDLQKAPTQHGKPPSSKQIVIDFFNGDYCIQGGSGWWKHEFCYGKYVRQFHEDQKGRDTITLGIWNRIKHVEWLQKNPSRRPKPLQERKSVYNFYSDGAICHETGKPRNVEVRFDCLKNSDSSNSISLYLIENVLCEYKLIVEASLFCEVIQSADADGLMNFNL